MVSIPGVQRPVAPPLGGDPGAAWLDDGGRLEWLKTPQLVKILMLPEPGSATSTLLLLGAVWIFGL